MSNPARKPAYDGLLAAQMQLGQVAMIQLGRLLKTARVNDVARIELVNRHAANIAKLYNLALEVTAPDEYRRAHVLWTSAIRSWHEAISLAFTTTNADPEVTDRKSRRAWRKAAMLIRRGNRQHVAAVQELEGIRFRRVLRSQFLERADIEFVA